MKWIRKWLRCDLPVLVLFGIIAIPFLSPIASNKLWPSHDATDLYTYLQLVDQARQGVQEGQFPLRVAPERYEGWRFPLFQWYAPLTFYMAGWLQAHVSPTNPYIAFKLMMWLALTAAGYSGYKLGRYVSRSRGAGLIAGGVCLTAPFLMVDMHVRFQMQECLSTGLLPLVVYFTLRAFASPRLRYVLLTGLAWGILTQIYSLGFLFGSIFAGGFIALLGTWRRGPKFKRLIRAGVGYGLGICLSLWYILPYAKMGSFFELELPKNSVTPLSFDQESPLSVLLAPVPVPMVEPGANQFFCYRLGWPLCAAVLILVYALLKDRTQRRISRKLAMPALLMTGIMIFLAWSPFHDLWKVVPVTLLKIQFPFRFLVQSVWLGALVTALAVRYLSPGAVKLPTVVAALFVIGLTGSLALPTNNTWTPDNKTRLEPVEKTLGMAYNGEFNHGRTKGGSVDYELYGHLVMNRYLYGTNGVYGNVESPVLQDYFGWLVTHPVADLEHYVLPTVNRRLKDFGGKRGWLVDDYVELPVPQSGMPTAVQLVGMIPFNDPASNAIPLTMLVNGQIASQQGVVPGSSVKLTFPLPALPQGTKTFRLQFKAEQGAQMDRPNEIADNMGRDTRLFVVQSLQFIGLGPADSVLPAQEVDKSKFVKGDTVVCNLIVPEQTGIVQIPAMYYPGMLDVRVDDKKVEPFPTFQRPFHWMASVRVTPSSHKITARFVGNRPANWISGLTGIGLVLGLVVVEIGRGRKQVVVVTASETPKGRKKRS